MFPVHLYISDVVFEYRRYPDLTDSETAYQAGSLLGNLTSGKVPLEKVLRKVRRVSQYPVNSTLVPKEHLHEERSLADIVTNNHQFPPNLC
jgi:hypothetical protein